MSADLLKDLLPKPESPAGVMGEHSLTHAELGSFREKADLLRACEKSGSMSLLKQDMCAEQCLPCVVRVLYAELSAAKNAHDRAFFMWKAVDKVLADAGCNPEHGTVGMAERLVRLTVSRPQECHCCCCRGRT